MSIIKHVTLQKIVAHDFRYVPRNMIPYGKTVSFLTSKLGGSRHFHDPAVLFQGKIYPQNPLSRRLCGPENRSEKFAEEIKVPCPCDELKPTSKRKNNICNEYFPFTPFQINEARHAIIRKCDLCSSKIVVERHKIHSAAYETDCLLIPLLFDIKKQNTSIMKANRSR